MAERIGEAVLDLDTRDRGLRRNTDRAQKRAERLGRTFDRVASRARLMGAAMVAGFGLMLRNSLQTIDAQAKLARSLNTTTESVQVMQRAGDLAGVRVGELNEGFSRLTRRLSLFVQDGGGPAQKAIEKLNLNAAELLDMPLDERMRVINQALEDFATKNERAALLSQLFGDRAFKAFQRLDTETINIAAQDVEELGIAVSKADADQIQLTNDALSRMGLILTGGFNQAAVAAAPALQRIADGMVAVFRSSGPMGRAIATLFGNLDRLVIHMGTFAAFLAGRWVFSMGAAVLATARLTGALRLLRVALIRTGIGALAVLIGELILRASQAEGKMVDFGAAMKAMMDVGIEVWNRLGLGVEAFKKNAVALFSEIQAAFLRMVATLRGAWSAFLAGVAATASDLPGMGSLADSIGAASAEAAAGMIEMEATASALEQRSKRLRGEAKGLKEDMVAPLESWRQLADAAGDAAEASEKIDPPDETGETPDLPGTDPGGGASQEADEIDRLIRGLQAERELLDLTDPAQRRLLQLREQLAGATDAQRARIEALVLAIEQERQAAEAAEAASDALGDAGFSALDAMIFQGKKLKEVFADLLVTIARMSLQATLLGKGPLAGLLGGGGAGGTGGILGSIFSGMFASGGTIPRGTFGIVGERGPEPVFATAGGIGVLPNSSLRQMSGGGGNVTVNIQTPNAESFRRARGQVAADIGRAVAAGRRNS